jgi:hypothetical protein
MNDIKSKHILRKYLLMIACLILFMAGGYRAFTLYKQYKSYNHEIESVLQNADNNVHAILKAILVEGHDIIENNTKNDAITLHRILIETMDIEDIYDNIVNMDLDDKFIKILDEVFNLSEKTDDIIITVGTKNYVFYSKSNVELDKFKYIESNGKKYLTWEEYYKQVDDKGVLHKAYEDLALERVDYVIIRKDGYYPNGKYYTIDDVIADYHENGMKNMDKYMILTMSVITENGDIFGEVDSNYLSKNENVNKIFIFKAVSIGSFLSNYTDLLAQCDQSVTVKIIEYRNSTEASNALVNIFLITSSIITIMVVIKSLDDECNEINNKLKNDEYK